MILMLHRFKNYYAHAHYLPHLPHQSNAASATSYSKNVSSCRCQAETEPVAVKSARPRIRASRRNAERVDEAWAYGKVNETSGWFPPAYAA